MIISVALPNVALRSPPIVWLVWSAVCSVASPSRAASGRIAKQQRLKMMASDSKNSSLTIAIGTNNSRMYKRLPVSIV